MPLKLNLPPQQGASDRTQSVGGGVRTPPPSRAPRGARGTTLRRVALGLGVVAALLGGGLVARHLDPTEPSGTGESPVAAVAAPPAANLGACVDRSFGLHRLGSQAIRAIRRSVTGYGDRTSPVPRSRAVAAVPGLDVRVRLVRPDSYTTTDRLNEGVLLRVPGTPGLAIAEPPSGSAAETLDAYERAHADTTEALEQATRVQRTASKKLKPLKAIASEGSDITGCLFALARDSDQKPLSAFVTSDFADSALTHANGTERGFRGDLSQVFLTVVAACSGSDPGRCEAHYQAFLDRAQGYGLDPARVTRLGPGQVDDAPTSWLTAGLDQVAVPAQS